MDDGCVVCLSVYMRLLIFVGYQSEEMGPQITACPLHHLCIPMHWLKNDCINDFSMIWLALKPLTPGAPLHYNQESKAGIWDPSTLGKVVVCSVITASKFVITSCLRISRFI